MKIKNIIKRLAIPLMILIVFINEYIESKTTFALVYLCLAIFLLLISIKTIIVKNNKETETDIVKLKLNNKKILYMILSMLSSIFLGGIFYSTLNDLYKILLPILITGIIMPIFLYIELAIKEAVAKISVNKNDN